MSDQDPNERFYRMEPAEAQAYLRNFLRQGEHGFRQVEEDLRRDGVDPDFSPASLVAVFEWLAAHVRVGEVEPSGNLPDFIVEAHRAGGAYLELLDEESEALARVGAYYLGQSFVARYPHLHWTVGPEGESCQNQPVVFIGAPEEDAELPPDLASVAIGQRFRIDYRIEPIGCAPETLDFAIEVVEAIASLSAMQPEVLGAGDVPGART